MDKQKGSVWVWIIVVVVILLLVWWIFSGDSEEPVVSDNLVMEEIQDPEAASIAGDLEGLDAIDLEAEFSDIEADLEQL